MSSATVWLEKKMSGIFFGLFVIFIVSVGLQIYSHVVLFPIIALVYLGEITKTLAFLLLLVPIYRIGGFYPDEKQTVNAAIISLVITLILDNILLYAGIGGVSLIVLATIYGVIMGCAFVMVHRSLSLPPDGYGNPFFLLYGWLFLIAEIILIIDTFFMSGIGIITILVEQYVSIGLLGIMAFKFLADAINRPLLQKKTKTSQPRKSAVYQRVQKEKARDIPSEEDAQITSEKVEDEIILNYCTFCGAQNFAHDKFCKNCGREMK
ncbi:MAG: zinc ribbon domain-containing protein [Candidatus Heimdallarchaeota archaeon]|nr:zinc ribbon domain-containing protein [Candidatus Heimdallarchaeota archaeon]MCK4610922.1 zinc ribbon domain-containing protein [Candidatus Heimdallarchaeota archaeon]